MAAPARSLHGLVVLIWCSLGACSEAPRLDPLPAGETEPIGEIGGGVDEDPESESEADADMPGCDPFGDPLTECGSASTCDPATRTCIPAPGSVLLGEPCTTRGAAGECAPGLVCAEGRCRAVCDPASEGACPSEAICALADRAWGVCLASCFLVAQTCSVPGEACNRVIGPSGVDVACTLNPGLGSEGAGCTIDQDCLPGLLCTDASQHSLGCVDAAGSCCTFACDLLELPCVGLEPVCQPLGIPGQEDAGFCALGD